MEIIHIIGEDIGIFHIAISPQKPVHKPHGCIMKRQKHLLNVQTFIFLALWCFVKKCLVYGTDDIKSFLITAGKFFQSHNLSSQDFLFSTNNNLLTVSEEIFLWREQHFSVFASNPFAFILSAIVSQYSKIMRFSMHSPRFWFSYHHYTNRSIRIQEYVLWKCPAD